MNRRKSSSASWECVVVPLPLATPEERESLCDCVHKAGWEGGGSEEAGGGVARFPHLRNISLWGNMLTLLMISMKDKHQGTRHWGLGSSWAFQQGDSPPTASLAERRHVFIKRRAFYVWWKQWDEQEISNRKADGRRQDPPPKGKNFVQDYAREFGFSFIKRNKEFPSKKNQLICLKPQKGSSFVIPVWTHVTQSSLFQWMKITQIAVSIYGQFIGTLKEKCKGTEAPVMPGSRCSNNFFFTKLPLCVLICLSLTVYILRLSSIAAK